LVITANAATNKLSCSQSTDLIVVSLEFFRPDHGHQQVNEQQQGNDANDKILHKSLLSLFAETDIETAHHEKQHYNSNVNQIIHKFTNRLWSLPTSRWAQLALTPLRRVIKTGALGVKNLLKLPKGRCGSLLMNAGFTELQRSVAATNDVTGSGKKISGAIFFNAFASCSDCHQQAGPPAQSRIDPVPEKRFAVSGHYL
jgi:hypothetical protein